MTPQEFVKAEVDLTKARRYASYQEWFMLYNKVIYGIPDYQQDEDYTSCRRLLLATIKDVSDEKAISWMKLFMVKAIAYGIESRNLDWKPKFLAAYKIFTAISRGERRLL